MTDTPSRIYLRAATAVDQDAIRAMIRAARLNPMHLVWTNFVVAEEIAPAGDTAPGCARQVNSAGRVVGVAQIKPHRDGSRELASVAVLPSHQGQGIGARMIEVLLAREASNVYLYCGDIMPAYYRRFGFVEVAASELPVAIRRWFRLGRAAVALLTLLPGEKHSLHAMKRSPA
jgi:N-acetylglutamate synthase-like GNAT family acetyltransferase